MSSNYSDEIKILNRCVFIFQDMKHKKGNIIVNGLDNHTANIYKTIFESFKINVEIEEETRYTYASIEISNNI